MSPRRSTTSSPLSVSKTKRAVSGSTKLASTQAVPRVAWPHRSISPPGVNQRSRQRPFSRTVKAVSERLFSIAMDCISSSGSHSSMTHTAAGLPSKTRSAKASTW